MRPRPQLVDDYLDLLEQALRTLPPARRREVVADVAEHIEAAMAEEGDGEAAIRQILDRLGDPEEIAREAGAALDGDLASRRPNWADYATIPLLLLGGLLWLVGWFVGLVLLWISPVFRTSDKILGTLLFPGGLAAPLALFAFTTAGTTTCIAEMGQTPVCDPVSSGPPAIVPILIGIAAVVGPVYSAVRLGRRIRAANAAADAAEAAANAR